MAIFNEEFLKENNLIYSSDEIINEQSIYVGKCNKTKYCIFGDVQINRNFDKDPYIKVYNNEYQVKATKVVRVSMKTGAPLPTEHTNKDKDAGKKRLKFTKEVAMFLTDAMNKEPNKHNYPDSVKTVYDAIYYDIDEMLNITCERFPIPNFEENIE